MEVQIDDAVEWETYKGGKFWHHAIAGASAGVSEHLIMYPFDTIKTNLQAARSTSVHCAKSAAGCGARNASGVAARDLGAAAYTTVGGAYRSIVREEGVRGLYRGVSAMAAGCVPAHVGYFSAYELVKEWTANYYAQNGSSSISSSSSSSSSSNDLGGSLSASGDSSKEGGASGGGVSAYQAWIAGSAAGCAASVTHDLVLTPLDVAKQRMQLGLGSNCAQCVKTVIETQGYLALYRSFPITLMTNVPFGAVLVGVNESLKTALNVTTVCNSSEEIWTKLPVYFGLAGFASGVAGLVTQPLDVIKTRIQTQQCLIEESRSFIKYRGVADAVSKILREEGARALFKGSIPRACVVIPSGAISWASYEAVKSFLMRNF